MPATPPAPAPAAGPPALPRVAVLAVHGIADQQRGDTGQAVALQLAAACGGSVLMHDLPLHAPPLDAAAPLGPSRPDTWQQRGLRSLQQSWRSDFLDDAIGGAPSTEGATGSAPAPRRNSAGAGAADAPTPSRAVADTGVRFTDYLLAQAQGARQAWGEPFNAAVGTVQGPHLRADVYEMYWADLSRLSGSVARIVAELFTLLFDLSRLGADELSLAGRLAGSRLLRTLGRVQRAADWLFSRVLALLALQLLMCAMLLLPALWPLAQGPGARRWAVGLVGVGCAAALVYRLHWRWRRALPAGAVLALAVAALVSSTVGPAALMLTWVGVLSAAYLGFLQYCEKRFRAVQGVGLALYAGTLAVVAWSGSRGGWAAFLHQQGWTDGGLGALEAVLLAQTVFWSLLVGLVAASVLLSEWALWRGTAGPELRQTLATARLGLFSSVGAFVLCLMLAFLMVNSALKPMLVPVSYKPWWFCHSQPEAAARATQLAAAAPLQAAAPAASAATQFVCGEAGRADLFVEDRAKRSAGSFALVAPLLLVLLGFVALVFGPSVLRELRLGAPPRSAALGRWLSTGYRAIEHLVRLWGPLVAVAALAVVAAFGLAAWARHGAAPSQGLLTQAVDAVDLRLQAVSDSWLGHLLVVVAGGAAGQLALGKVAIKQLQALRAPLDAALDVDNHFREFPRHAISRVRIVERYVALLDHLRAQGYERVVIVAHSQGTVITAELLRYLQQRSRLADAHASTTPGQVDLVRLQAWLQRCGVHLLTVGSPLRQLYALRFPSQYPWVLAPVQHSSGQAWWGPQPHELGLRRWTNLWGSGDYVGRWLWSAPDDTRPPPLQVDDSRYGDVVHQGQDDAGRPWRDRCLGADAHTHYFDLDQPVVGAELLALVHG